MTLRPAILLLAALAAPAQQIILDFEGADGEHRLYSVSGSSSYETRLVRSGSSALRVTFSPPQKWPGLRIFADALRQRGHRDFCIDVHNPGPGTVPLWVRIDDAGSRGVETELVRRRFELQLGWNVLRIPLASLQTPGGRHLDAEALSLVILHQNLPATAVDLVFDSARFEGPPPPRPGAELAAYARDFATRYVRLKDYEARRGALREAEDRLSPALAAALGRRVLDEEEDARLIEEGIALLGRARDPATVAAMIAAAEASKGPLRWRWLDALGRTGSPAALEHLRRTVETTTSSEDETAAILALGRPGRPGDAHLLDPTRSGTWQVKTARVEVLRRLGLGPSFPFLIDYVSAEEARVRADAHAALVALSGRDLGLRADLWHAWWNAEAERRARGEAPSGAGREAASSSYGTYYGLPLASGRLAFVIDVSGSMKTALNAAAQDYVQRSRHLQGRDIRTRIDLAKAELEHAVRALPDSAHIQLVSFEEEVMVWSREGPRRATSDAKADLLRRAANLQANGSTNIHGALLAAFAAARNAPPRVAYRDSADTIYLLSDGDPTAGEIREVPHLLADIRERNRVRRIRIHTIGLGGPGSPLLAGLARSSGGSYVDLAR
jgi:hypothetical protein